MYVMDCFSGVWYYEIGTSCVLQHEFVRLCFEYMHGCYSMANYTVSSPALLLVQKAVQAPGCAQRWVANWCGTRLSMWH